MQIISKNFHVQNIYKNLSCLDLSRFEACIKTRIFQYSKKEKSRLYHVFHFLERDNGRRHPSSIRFLSFRVLRAFVLFSILLPSSPSFFLEAWSLINLAPSPRNREFSHLRDRIVPWKKNNQLKLLRIRFVQSFGVLRVLEIEISFLTRIKVFFLNNRFVINIFF